MTASKSKDRKSRALNIEPFNKSYIPLLRALKTQGVIMSRHSRNNQSSPS